MDRNLHLQYVLLDSDNQIFVETCKYKQKRGAIRGIIEEINEIQIEFRGCEITWIAREDNEVAH